VLFTLPALVLEKEKYQEIDLLVRFLTPRGKLRALAKGAQKSKRRFLNLLEPLTYLRIHIRKPKKGFFPILEGADLLYLPESPRENLKKFFFFSYLSEVLDYTAPEALKGEDFLFLVNFLKDLDKRELTIFDKLFFDLKWLKVCGVYPQVFQCVRCGREPKRFFYFSIREGGILCFNCKIEPIEALTFSQIDLLKKIVRIKGVDELLRNGEVFSEEDILKLCKMVEEFFIYHLDWEPKSLKILREELCQMR